MSNNTGKNSKFKKIYCKKIVEHGKEGISFESFAAVVGVSRKTLYNWTSQYPEFASAKEEAESASLLFYEKMGVDMCLGNIKPNNIFIFMMANKHKWSRVDKVDQDVEAKPIELKLSYKPSKNEQLELEQKQNNDLKKKIEEKTDDPVH